MGIVLAIFVVASVLLVARYDPGIFSANAPPPTDSPPTVPTNSTVQVLTIDYRISNCFANTTVSGFNTVGGSAENLELSLSNSGVHTCIVNAVSVLVAGFSVSHSNTPLAVPPAQKGTLQYTLQTPNFHVDQGIAIDLTVTVLS